MKGAESNMQIGLGLNSHHDIYQTLNDSFTLLGDLGIHQTARYKNKNLSWFQEFVGLECSRGTLSILCLTVPDVPENRTLSSTLS